MPTRTALSVLLVATAVLLVAAMPPPAPILSAPIQLSPAALPDFDRFLPAIAYNQTHQEYLVAWHNRGSALHCDINNCDIYARRVTTSGELKSWFVVATGTKSRFAPSVAYNALNDNYLVVWMQDPGDAVHYEIWGRIVAWDGSSMGTAFQILTWPNRAFWYPRVVWNSIRNEYLMVANGVDTLAGKLNDITGRRLSAAGVVVGGVLVYQNSNYSPQQPSLTYNFSTDEYLVVWRHRYSDTDYDIHGARVRGDGSIPLSNILLDDSTKDQESPAVTTNRQGRYLVVWRQKYTAGDWDIYGKEFDVNGDAVAGSYAIADSPDDERDPAVVGKFGVANATDFMAVWQRTTATDAEIWASRWGTTVSGSSSGTFRLSAAAPWSSHSPVVAVGWPSYLIAYESDFTMDPTVFQHIYARVWSPEGMFLPLLRK